MYVPPLPRPLLWKHNEAQTGTGYSHNFMRPCQHCAVAADDRLSACVRELTNPYLVGNSCRLMVIDGIKSVPLAEE